MSGEKNDSRDGAKRRGVSLGPQASQILQRLYEPHLGPASPSKQAGVASASLASPLSPLKRDAMGGGGALKPKQQRMMRKTASVATLAPDSSSAMSSSASAVHATSPIGRISGSRALGASASVAMLSNSPSSAAMATMHPTLLHVRLSVFALSPLALASALLH